MPNSSRNPNQVLIDAEQKGYSRILFQQGKPVCDFELTLLGDLANPQRMAAQYIGSGVPAGNDGFAISDLNVAGSDFAIKAGRCLVNGKEVVLATNTTYKNQPHQEQIRNFSVGKSNVYLRVFPREVTDAEDASLANQNDVGTVTALREKTDWEVVVSAATINQPGHFLLATIDTSANVVTKVTDRRRKELTMSSLRDQFDAFAGVSTGLAERLNASLTAEGALKAGVVGNTQLAKDSVTSDKIADANVTVGKLAANAVQEATLSVNSVSKRTIQNRVVAMSKLDLSSVVRSKVSVPVAKAVGLLGQQVIVPGELPVVLQEGDEHAFFLISVRVLEPRVKGGNGVNWMHRSVGIATPTLADPNATIHQHQVVLQNLSTETAVTVEVTGFRIADA